MNALKTTHLFRALAARLCTAHGEKNQSETGLEAPYSHRNKENGVVAFEFRNGDAAKVRSCRKSIGLSLPHAAVAFETEAKEALVAVFALQYSQRSGLSRDSNVPSDGEGAWLFGDDAD